MIYRIIGIILGIYVGYSPVTASDHDDSFISMVRTELNKLGKEIIARPFITAAMDCPLDVAIIKRQVSNQPYSSIIRNTYNQFGLKGFYQGLWPKFVGAVGKNFYTWPALMYGPQFFEKFCPNTLWGGNQLAASLTYAMIDAFFITPLERIRVLQITQPYDFKVSQLRLSMIPEMFKGTSLTFQQGVINCSTFMLLEKVFRSKAKELHHGQELSWFHYASIGSSISFIQTTLTHPLATLRVKVQTTNLVPNHQQRKNMRHILWETLKNTKPRHLQAGWALRFIRGAITNSIDSYFVNRIEQNIWVKKE